MESPVVVDKPPEYHGKPENSFTHQRGFPFEEEQQSSGRPLSGLAARLADHDWARKRRPNSHDFEDSFGNFDRGFLFEEVPPHLREYFAHRQPPRRFEEGARPSPPRQHCAATQTDDAAQPPPAQSQAPLGRSSSGAEAEAEPRGARAGSAPPHAHDAMSGHEPHEPRVKIIPIQVEGRESPCRNDDPHHRPEAEASPLFGRRAPTAAGGHFADRHDLHDRFARAPSPFHERQIPVHHVHSQPKQGHAQAQSQHHRPQAPPPHQAPQPQAQPQQQQQQAPYQQRGPPSPQAQPQQQRGPPPQQGPPPPPEKPAPAPAKSPASDPITQILAIQTDVLNLMTEVENFTGAKNDKQYLYLDEMLTRNLIKLDDIQANDNENIRAARKAAITCIQKCITVLEAKAESNKATAEKKEKEEKAENGQVEMKEEPKAEGETAEATPDKDEAKTESEPQQAAAQPEVDTRPQQEEKDKPKKKQTKETKQSKENKQAKENKQSKEAKENKQAKDAKESKESNESKAQDQEQKAQAMQVDENADKAESQPKPMEVDEPAAAGQ